MKEEIDDLLGPSISFWERLRIKGNGSSRLLVVHYSSDFSSWIEANNSTPYGQIEKRPKGYIFRFRSRLETIAWLLPKDKFTWEHSGNLQLTLKLKEAFLIVETNKKGMENLKKWFNE